MYTGYNNINELQQASKDGNLPLVKSLVSKGFDFSCLDNSAFKWACKKGHLGVVDFLVSESTRIGKSIGKKHGNEGMQLAASEGYLGVVKYLVDNGIANLTDSDTMRTYDNSNVSVNALQYAAANGCEDVVEYLLNQDCCTKKSIQNAFKAVSSLAFEGIHLPIAKLLICKGASIQECNTNKAFFVACYEGKLDVVTALVDIGFDCHTDNEAALLIAYVNKHSHIAEFLLEKGANILNMNKHIETLLNGEYELYLVEGTIENITGERIFNWELLVSDMGEVEDEIEESGGEGFDTHLVGECCIENGRIV